MGIAITSVSIVFQFIAAFLAVQVAVYTRRKAMLPLALAILLMGIRRSYSLYNSFAYQLPIDLGAETIALAISTLMLLGLGMLNRSAVALRQENGDIIAPATSRRGESTLPRIAIFLGATAVVGSFVIGYLAYGASNHFIRENIYRNDLDLARALGTRIDKEDGTQSREARLRLIESQWKDLKWNPEDGFLCVVGGDGRLLLNTKRPEKVGVAVGGTAIGQRRENGPSTVGELVAAKEDWTGENVNHSGELQLAAYAYDPELDALVAVHRSNASVTESIDRVVTPWIGGLMLVSLLVVPASLTLMHWAYAITFADRERAEQELKEIDERFALFMDHIPGLVHVCDDEQRFVYLNRTYEESFGIARDEWLGKTIDEAMPTEIAERQRETSFRVLSDNETIEAIEDIPHRDGMQHYLTQRFPIPREGRSTWLGCLGIDITERKRAENEREHLLHELEARNAEMERFTYTVSHDLKSPLITIRGFLGLLEEDIANGRTQEVGENLAEIKTAAAQMQLLLTDLLELSRVGRVIGSKEHVSVGELAREAVNLLAGPIADNNVEIEIAPDLPTVFGDRGRLLEVLQNLVENSIKFMGDEPHPRITIGKRQNGGDTVCFVGDNGKGLAPQHHERVFGLFDKLDPQAEGTGIGLALIKRIIEVHGGRIWAESDGPGHGCTFCFTIPDAEEDDD